MTRALTHSELENLPSLEWSDIAPRMQLRNPLGTRTSDGNAGRRHSYPRTVRAAGTC